MMTELQAAGIIACAAITFAAICVALAAKRTGHHDRATIDTDHARRLGIEIERHKRRLAEIEAHLARIGHQPGPLVPPRPASRMDGVAPPNDPRRAQGVYAPVTLDALGVIPPELHRPGAHDAHRARTVPDWVTTVRMGPWPKTGVLQ